MFHAALAGHVPALHPPGSATAREDARVYSEHNCTHTEVQRFEDGGLSGTITKTPMPVSDQCRCGNCQSHIRRAGVTAVGEPGKERVAV